jgi:hypothetical protein
MILFLLIRHFAILHFAILPFNMSSGLSIFAEINDPVRI